MLTTQIHKQIAQAFTDTDQLATCLLALTLDHYGSESLDWSWDTLKQELSDDFDVTLPQVNVDKLHALQTALTSDTFYRDPVVFHHVCKALNNEPVDFDNLTPTEPDEMGWAVFEVRLNDNQQHSFDQQVRLWMGAGLSWVGVHHAPRVLGQALFPADQLKQASENLSGHSQAGAFHDRSLSTANEVDDFVKQKFRVLLDQLNRLPLQNRDKESWTRALQRIKL